MKVRKPYENKLRVILPGTVNPVHRIPAVGEEADDDGMTSIDLSTFEDWDELTIDKQRYLVAFSKSKLKEKRAAVMCGISTRQLAEWKRNDRLFVQFFEDIVDLHVEAVEEIDYMASFHTKNNTSRGRFLSKRSKIYNEEKTRLPAAPIGTQNNVFAIFNSKEVSEKGLAGVQKAFNRLKEQGQSIGEVRED